MMSQPMRCPFCGLLQDEPAGVKECSRCGGGLQYESRLPGRPTYLRVEMELDQVVAPADQNLERFMLITIQTPKEVPKEEAVSTEAGRPPLNFCAVLDVSGSMQGEKIEQAKLAVQRAVKYLRTGDIFSLVTFSDNISIPFEPNLVNETTPQVVGIALQQINAGGMTALCSGLETGIEKAGVFAQDSNLVLLLSDGQANVGETDLEKIGSRALQARKAGRLVSCLGVGLDYNEAQLTEIATQGGGRFYHVQNANQIPAYLAGELGEVATLAAREVKIQLSVPNGATLIPLSAAYPVQQAAEQAVVTIGDIPCDTELEISLRLALLAQPTGSKLSIQGTLVFHSPVGHEIECQVNRVTIRFVAPDIYHLRQGVVQPIAERVFAQMKASSVLSVSRILAVQPKDAGQKAEAELNSLYPYADLLGEGRVEREMLEVKKQFANLTASPAAAKQTVANANRFIRSTKDFDH